MKLTWESGASWFERTYTVEHDDRTIASFDDQPTLDELRKIDRKHGDPTDRLDLWQAGLLCRKCDKEINARFGATPEGEILCWDCAMASDSSDQQDLTVNTDPTK